MFQNIGLPEILVVMFVIFIFFGKNTLTELAKTLGKSGREFKKIGKEYESTLSEIKKDLTDDELEEKPKKKKKIKK
jgi:sec-independent protein translocase protein TatA